MDDKKTEKEDKKSGAIKTVFILLIIIFLVSTFFFCANSLTGEEETRKTKSSVSVPPKTKTISINEAGVFNFELQPLESLGNWWYVEEGLNYCLSSARKDHSFFVKYKRGDLVKIEKDNVSLPDRAGPFKLVAGEQEVKITLLVSRRT